jgi:hypothetical protein
VNPELVTKRRPHAGEVARPGQRRGGKLPFEIISSLFREVSKLSANCAPHNLEGLCIA